jgi:putative transposase
MTPATKSPHAGHRFPPEVISQAIWLHFRFPLSLRMVEEMLAARGILVSHEPVRQLDEVVITIAIAGKKHWLWRAVDQDGLVLDVLVQSRGDKRADKRLLRKLLKKQSRPPRVLITDKLAGIPFLLKPGIPWEKLPQA